VSAAQVVVVGQDGRPLPAAVHEALRMAALVVGGRRHLAAVNGIGSGRRVELGSAGTAWADAVTQVVNAAAAGDACVVLASGDPGFFGVVRSLRQAGADVRSWPGTSSVAEAFGRIGRSWEDAVIVSAHGRPAATALAAARTLAKVAVLTGPQAPAELFVDALRAAGRDVWVAERLGEPDERVRHGADCVPPYAEPNVVLAMDSGEDELRWRSGNDPVPDGWALAEDAFEHRDSMVTKSEVRALALARLAPRVGQTIWDVGAGSGSVDEEQCDRLRRNASRHSVRIEVVSGSAPEAFTGLRQPDAVFIGGGGSEVVEQVAALAAPRRVVVALAALERVGPAIKVLQQSGFAVEGVQLQASRLRALPDGTHRLAAANPVTLVSGVRS